MSFDCEIPADAVGLAAALHVDDRYTARLTMAVGQFVVDREWDRQGYANPVQWLKDAAGMTGPDAFRMVVEAKKLRQWPVLAAAWVAGEVTGGQVRIICAQVIERHVRLFASDEADLVPGLAKLSIDDTLTAMRLWRDQADARDAAPDPTTDRTEVKLTRALDDRGVLHANLDAEGYALAAAALDLADPGDFALSAPERRGEALKAIWRFFLERQTTKTVRRQRPHVTVTIDAQTLGTPLPSAVFAATGMPASGATLERILCDCDLHRMLLADGAVLDYGRGARTAPAALYNALIARDGGCRFPGCDRPPEACDVHHVVPYSVGGETTIDNCVLACWSHHPVLHRDGWSAALARDGTVTVTSPDGETRTSLPQVITLQHLRALVGLAPDPDAHDSPVVDHVERVAAAVGARKRIDELIAQARLVRAIINTVSLGTRPPWREYARAA
jgi:hypothetical protein